VGAPVHQQQAPTPSALSDAEIVAKLDLGHEFAALGIKALPPEGHAGWHQSMSLVNPGFTCNVNLRTGYLHDMAIRTANVFLFEFAVMRGAFFDVGSARRYYRSRALGESIPQFAFQFQDTAPYSDKALAARNATQAPAPMHPAVTGTTTPAGIATNDPATFQQPEPEPEQAKPAEELFDPEDSDTEIADAVSPAAETVRHGDGEWREPAGVAAAAESQAPQQADAETGYVARIRVASAVVTEKRRALHAAQSELNEAVEKLQHAIDDRPPEPEPQKPTLPAEIVGKPFAELTTEQVGLSPGICKSLAGKEIKTMGQLAAWTEPLTKIPGIGKGKAEAIEKTVSDFFQQWEAAQPGAT
jgi:hypothetical protein